MASFASSVTVVTAGAAAQPVGLTVSAFTSVSLDPPLVLICLDERAYSTQTVVDWGGYTVNILPEGTADLAIRFATRGVDKFAGVETLPPTTPRAGPVLAEAMAILECRIVSATETGDHWILVGEVLHSEVRHQAHPLIYHARRFVGLADPE